jgi:hypothetical protein
MTMWFGKAAYPYIQGAGPQEPTITRTVGLEDYQVSREAFLLVVKNRINICNFR